MGIDPSDTFTYWLPDDLSKPESERRGLVYAHGTAAHWRRFSADYRAALDLSTDTYLAKLAELAERGLVGRKNLADGPLEELLTQLQIVDLCNDLPTASIVSEVDKKKLRSQSPTATASSAKTAAPGGA